jgi:transglutaminase-like putative cysteine protease
MRWRGRWLAAVLAMAAAVPAMAREVLYEGRPDWVVATPVPLDVQAPPGQTTGGVQYLLADNQTRLEPHDRAIYRHYAMRALTGDGVEDIAHVQVSFDPSYETLTLHAIRVLRGGRVLPRLDPAKVKVLQQEKDLEARIYDGRKTANVLLEDVRVGDVVDYEYTVRGLNPAFRERASGSFQLSWKAPVDTLVARLVVPEGREPFILPRNAAGKPAISHRDGWIEYLWRARQVPAQASDDDEPGWYDPFASVQWSEFADWAAVAAWAMPLYKADPDQGAELRAQVAAIAAASADPGERLLAVLRYVQGEVRYLGIEVGIGSLAPRQPREVIARRFGDCKDKALLTVWMLRALGIEAAPALVNTHLRQALDTYHPTPALFDHVVVRAHVGDRTWWLDPTRSPQKGTLDTLSQASFGRALVVAAQTTAPETMIEPRDVVRRRDIHTVFDATGGRGKPMTMDVTTVYQGEAADSMRSDLASASRDELQRHYLNFYAGYYPGVAVARPFTVSDDEPGNRLTVTESYTVGDLWKRSDERKRYDATFYDPDIDAQLHTPDRTVRTGPMALAYPLTINSVTEIRLHKDWSLDLPPGTVDDPAFRLHVDSRVNGAVVTLTESLQMLADHVEPNAIAGFADKVRSARDLLGVRLLMPDVAPGAAGSGVNWPVVLLGLVMLAGAAWLARRAWRYDPPPRTPTSPDAPSGLRGWLILPMLGIVFAPFRMLHDLSDLIPTYASSSWMRLTIPGSDSYSPWWAPYLLSELGCNLVLAAFWVMLPVAFFRRRTSLPRLFIVVSIASLVVRVLDLVAGAALSVATTSDAREWAELARDTASTLLWSWYFLASRRVAATFVVRLGGAGKARPVADVAAVAAPAEAPSPPHVADAAPPPLPPGEPTASQA